MSENNNEKENSIFQRSSKSTPLPLLLNSNTNSNDLPPSTILLHKRTNSITSQPINSGGNLESSSILNLQTNSDSHSIEFQSQNLLENELTRRKSIMSNFSSKMSVHRSIKTKAMYLYKITKD